MPYSNPLKQKEFQKIYYIKNKEEIVLKRQTIEAKTRRNLLQSEKRRNRRIEVINLFGGKCVKCGFKDWRALQIDHVNGGGNKEINSFKDIYKYLEFCASQVSSGKYQLLCANCNWIKRYENKEERKIN